MKLPLGSSDYYEFYPSADHQAGDIWADLPTHGVLPPAHLPGVVITPACDLVNRKVETITYLPIVSVASYFTSRSYLPEILKTVNGQLEAAGLRAAANGTKHSPVPSGTELSLSMEMLTQHRNSARLNMKETAACDRAEAGLRCAIGIHAGGDARSLLPLIKLLFTEKTFPSKARELVENKQSSDVHFLPRDEQREEWSVVSEPSVALFRYPLSIPIDILDLAQTVSAEDWGTEVKRLRSLYPCAEGLTAARPLKALRVRPRFVSDLLTRFTGLFGRIGSPDFDSSTIERYVDEIGG